MFMRMRRVVPLSTVDELQALLNDEAFADGTATAAGTAARVKRNLQVPPGNPVADKAAAELWASLRANPVFELATLPVRVQGPLFSRYDEGMEYGDHLDAAVMGNDPPVRADIAVTVFLSDPASYDGGELVVATGFGHERVKAAAGDCVIYPATTLHHVAPVTRGSRLAAVMWIQSAVRDPAQRKILFDLGAVLEYLDQNTDLHEPVERLRQCQVNLTRMWSQT